MIKELKATGLRQTEIAKLTKMSESYISDLLNGKRGARMSHDKYVLLVNLHQSRTRRKKK